MPGKTGLERKFWGNRSWRREGGQKTSSSSLHPAPEPLSSCLRSSHVCGDFPSLVLHSRSDSSPPGSQQCCVSLCKSCKPGEPSARKPGVFPRTVQGQGSSALLSLGSLPSLKTGNDHTLQCRTSTGAEPTLHPLCKPRVVVVLAKEHSVKPS